MRESIPISVRLFMGWKVGNSHSAQSIILGYTRSEVHASQRAMLQGHDRSLPLLVRRYDAVSAVGLSNRIG